MDFLPLVVAAALGVIVGAVLTIVSSGYRAKQQERRARLALAESKMRRAAERLMQQNNDLKREKEALEHRHQEQLYRLERRYTAEIDAADARVAEARRRILAAGIDWEEIPVFTAADMRSRTTGFGGLN